MKNVFSTVNGKLLSNPATSTTIPDWIDNIQFTLAPKTALQLNTDNHIVNSRTVLAERSNLVGNIREIKNSFNDKTAKQTVVAKLTKILSGYRFVVNDISCDMDKGTILANINLSNNPLTYHFGFTIDDGHINHNKFFKTSINGRENEYSFSRAGLDDSLNDAKNVDKKESVMVKQAEAKVSRMTRMEIIRRCGGKLRLAQEAIDKQIKEGNIIPIGSNEYGSAYSMEKLFPDLNDDYVPEKSHTAEFVDNKVSTNINEHKTNERLKIESASILSDVFNVHKIINATRDDNKLFVTAEVVNNNVRNQIACSFTIENEKIGKLTTVEFENGERMSVAQAMKKLNNNEKVAKYLNNQDAKIAGGYVYSLKDIHNILGNFVNVRNVYSMVNDLCAKKYASKLNTSTIASKYSLNELLRFANAELLSDDEIAKIRADKAYFGQGQKFYSHETQDNDTRNRIATAKIQNKHLAVNEFVNRFFKNTSVKHIADNNYIIIFNGEKPRKISASVIYDNNSHICDIRCTLCNKQVSLYKVRDYFKKSPLLVAYAKINDSQYDGKVILSKRMFINKLNNLLDNNGINTLITNLVDTNQIHSIGNNQYVSDVSFDELIRTSNIIPDSTRTKYILAVSDKTAGMELNRHYEQDNDTRTVKAELSVENAKAQLARILPKNIICLSCNATDVNDDNVKFMVRCFNKDAGVARNLVVVMDRYGNELSNLRLHIGNKQVTEEEAFKTTKLTAAVNTLRGGINGQFIMTDKKLKNVLADLVDKDTVHEVVNSWEKLGLIKRIDSNTFAGNVSLNNLLETANIVMYDEDTRKRIQQAKCYFGDLQGFERVNIIDNDTRDNELITNKIKHAVDINSKFDKYFNNFNVKELGNNKYLVKFAINDMKHKLYAYEQDGKIYCSIKNRNLPIEQVFNLFKKNKLLVAYAKVYKENNNKSVITKQQFMNKLGGLLQEDTINYLINNLVSNNHLTKLSSTQYACEYGIDELLRYVSEDIQPDENIGKQKLVKANRQVEAFEDAYVDDTDNRNITATITNNDIKQQFASLLPKYIQCLDISNINIDNDNVTFNTKCFNRNKSNESVFNVVANIHNARITNIKVMQNGKETNFDDGIKMNIMSSDYQKVYNNRPIDKYAIVFDRHQLEQKLKHIANLDNLNDVISNWEKLGKIKKINSTKFASDKTLVELLNESNILPYTDNDIHHNFEKASAIQDYIPKQYHSKDFGSKSIEQIGDQRKRDELIKAKKSLANRIKQSYHKQLITVAKAKDFVKQLKQADNIQSLSKIQNDLNRYQ